MSEAETRHDWWVVSSAVNPPTLLLEDRVRGTRGFVRPETKEEWRRAWGAPSAPYRYEGDPRRISSEEPAPSSDEMSQLTTATTLMEAQSRSRLVAAMYALLDRLRPYMRAYTTAPEVEMPEHGLSWVSFAADGTYEDSPGRVILEAMKTHPELWLGALPKECCIVPRRMVEHYLGKDVAEVLATHGASMVANQGARALAVQQQQERAKHVGFNLLETSGQK